MIKAECVVCGCPIVSFIDSPPGNDIWLPELVPPYDVTPAHFPVPEEGGGDDE